MSNNPLRPSLDEIACRLGTDKSTLTMLPAPHDGYASRASQGTGYSVFYEHYFEPLRTQPIRLLEIGVLDGRSLAMWNEYFPLAEIYGVDLDPECRRLAGGRVKVFIGSQDDQAFLSAVRQAVPSGFDIVIDDGSHYVKHMIASFHELFDHVVPGGYYVIEDLNVAADRTWGMQAFNRGMAMRPHADGNDPRELIRFLHEVRVRDDVAELSVHLKQICFVQKRRTDGLPDVRHERGDRLESLYQEPQPLWRRAAGRLRRLIPSSQRRH